VVSYVSDSDIEVGFAKKLYNFLGWFPYSS